MDGGPGGLTDRVRFYDSRWEWRITLTTSVTSRRAFLAGGAVAVGGLAIAGRLVLAPSPKVLHGSAAAGETISLYVLDLPRPPGDTG
jgi:hypothetical protein